MSARNRLLYLFLHMSCILKTESLRFFILCMFIQYCALQGPKTVQYSIQLPRNTNVHYFQSILVTLCYSGSCKSLLKLINFIGFQSGKIQPYFDIEILTSWLKLPSYLLNYDSIMILKKILLKSYLQVKFHGTGVIFAMVTMFPHFPLKCGACVTNSFSVNQVVLSQLDFFMSNRITLGHFKSNESIYVNFDQSILIILAQFKSIKLIQSLQSFKSF